MRCAQRHDPEDRGRCEHCHRQELPVPGYPGVACLMVQHAPLRSAPCEARQPPLNGRCFPTRRPAGNGIHRRTLYYRQQWLHSIYFAFESGPHARRGRWRPSGLVDSASQRRVAEMLSADHTAAGYEYSSRYASGTRTVQYARRGLIIDLSRRSFRAPRTKPVDTVRHRHHCLFSPIRVVNGPNHPCDDCLRRSSIPFAADLTPEVIIMPPGQLTVTGVDSPARVDDLH